MPDCLSREEEKDSLLANAIARTGGKGLQYSPSVIVKDGVAILEPALRDEGIGFGEVIS